MGGIPGIYRLKLFKSTTPAFPISNSIINKTMSTYSFAAVFDIVELLESVLLQLTLNDLLPAQRVSRHWQHIITASSGLQQKLLFQPELPSFISSPHFNPLLEA